MLLINKNWEGLRGKTKCLLEHSGVVITLSRLCSTISLSINTNVFFPSSRSKLELELSLFFSPMAISNPKLNKDFEVFLLNLLHFILFQLYFGTETNATLFHLFVYNLYIYIYIYIHVYIVIFAKFIGSIGFFFDN